MKKKYILVSGGSGYIGSNLIKHLIDLNYLVISLDYRKNQFSHKNLIKFKIDITSFDKISKALKSYKISYIFHLGAISDIEFSVLNPKKTLNNNIFSTYNLLKIGTQKKINRFIFASSIYTNSSQGSFYRISKICSEEIIEEYHRLNKLDFTIVRYGSLFGDINFQNTINNVIKSAINRKCVLRQGNGTELRNYISIDDAVALTAKLISKKLIKKYYNIVGNEKMVFKDIIKIIKKELPNLKIKYSNISNPHHYLKTPFNKKEKKYYNLTINKKNYLKNSLKLYVDKISSK